MYLYRACKTCIMRNGDYGRAKVGSNGAKEIVEFAQQLVQFEILTFISLCRSGVIKS